LSPEFLVVPACLGVGIYVVHLAGRYPQHNLQVKAAFFRLAGAILLLVGTALALGGVFLRDITDFELNHIPFGALLLVAGCCTLLLARRYASSSTHSPDRRHRAIVKGVGLAIGLVAIAAAVDYTGRFGDESDIASLQQARSALESRPLPDGEAQRELETRLDDAISALRTR
jgi:hypothetical protein